MDGAVRPGGRRTNLIIDWLARRAERCDAYLQDLALIDRTLRERLGEAYRAARRTDRLALALFVDFARGQTLSAGELAMLMADARADAVDAVRYLIDEAARTPANAPRGAKARVTEDPSRTSGRRGR